MSRTIVSQSRPHVRYNMMFALPYPVIKYSSLSTFLDMPPMPTRITCLLTQEARERQANLGKAVAP